MSRDVTTAFARTLVDEWARAGLTDAVLAPGSRSAPLALALARDERFRVHVHVDERSAGGFALGLARGSGRPPILLSTSGTAAALFHGAVLEAHHGRVPLVVCTADRPPELRDVGAGQTVDQRNLYGPALRWAHDPGPPDDGPGVGAVWRHLGARSVAEAFGPPAGPVHLNLPFREPLVPSGAPLVDAPGRPDGAPWVRVLPPARQPDRRAVAELVHAVRRHPRGVIVAGWESGATPQTVARFAALTGWPVLADPLSGLRAGTDAVSTYEGLLRVSSFAEANRPDMVLRLGAPPTNKTLGAWLDDQLDVEIPTFLVDPDDAWLDPGRAASTHLVCDPEALLAVVIDALGEHHAPDHGWRASWRRAERAAREMIDARCDDDAEPFEGRIARDVVACLPDGATLVVASSMPVRDVESFAAPRTGVRFVANRGVNGIDGFVSTALGVAAASPRVPVVALLGDLCLLHDVNGLVGAARRELDAVLVVVDNDGGGIFSFLPQGNPDTVAPDDFELLFGTPHGLDPARIAAAYDIPCTVVELADELAPAITKAIDVGGVQMVLVRTDRSTNVAKHRAIWEAVAAAVVPGR